MYDVVIVGGGPAGLSAALVLGRARRSVAVVDAGEPRNAAAHESHGFLTRDGIPPDELLRLGGAEVAGYGVELLSDRVVEVTPGFTVRLASGAVLSTRHVLVTAGVRDELPDVPGVAELWGGDVHFCPYCHGYEVRDEQVGVVSDGPTGVIKALMLKAWAPDVVLFPSGYEPTAEESAQLAARGVPVEPGKVTRLVTTAGKLTGCALDDHGWVHTDPTGRTTVPNVWAAGNVVDPKAQLISSAGAGAATAVALNHDLIFTP
jgi:thioredoxin reductase